MNVLIIDTSTDAVAISCGSSAENSTSSVVSQVSLHSENILVAISHCLDGQQITTESLDVIGVGIGPGLFTGLRVGITAAHAMAQALGIPVVSFSSLELAALSCLGSDPLNGAKVIVAKDARRHEVYTASYESTPVDAYECTVDGVTFASTLNRIDGEQLLSPQDFSDRVNSEHVAVFLDDEKRYEEFDSIQDRTSLSEITLRPSSVIDLVQSAHAGGIHTDVMTPRALYLRKSDAELSWGVAR